MFSSPQKLFILIIGWFIVSSCGSSQEASHQDGSHAVRENLSHKDLIILEEVYEVSPAFRNQLLEVFKAYLELKDSFVSSDNSAVSVASKNMQQKVGEWKISLLEGEGLKAAGNHKTVLEHSLTQLRESTSLYGKRTHFSHISEALYCSIKSFGLDTTSKIYTDYCPMAFENQGAFWLSMTKEIRNPYFGDQMLTCGEIREVFN